jgi:hypothetical protein
MHENESFVVQLPCHGAIAEDISCQKKSTSSSSFQGSSLAIFFENALVWKLGKILVYGWALVSFLEYLFHNSLELIF